MVAHETPFVLCFFPHWYDYEYCCLGNAQREAIDFDRPLELFVFLLIHYSFK